MTERNQPRDGDVVLAGDTRRWLVVSGDVTLAAFESESAAREFVNGLRAASSAAEERPDAECALGLGTQQALDVDPQHFTLQWLVAVCVDA